MSVIRRKASNSQNDWKQRQKRKLIQQAGSLRKESEVLQEMTISLQSSNLYALNYMLNHMLPNLNQSVSYKPGKCQESEIIRVFTSDAFGIYFTYSFFHLLGLGTRQQSNQDLVSFDLSPQLFVMPVEWRFQILCQLLVSLALDNRLIALFS